MLNKNNVHYINFEINSFTADTVIEKNKVLYENNDIPEWDNIKVFTWIFSENFTKWKKSRNWYKYDQNWWELKNYSKVPLILWQHDEKYWWIWKALEIYIDKNNNLWGKFYIDLELLDDRNRKQVERWMVNMLSTWAITLDWAFEENDTWKRFTEQKAIEKFWFTEVYNALVNAKDSILTYVVTKAELVENSLVTIWSNAWAIARSLNSMNDEMQERAKILSDLYFNNNNMNKKKNDAEVTEQSEVVETVENEEVTESTESTTEEWAVAEVEPKAEEPIEAPAEPVETPTEDNSIKELKDDIKSKEVLINSLTDKVANLEKQLNSFRESQRDKVMANAKIENWVSSMSDFSKKYF